MIKHAVIEFHENDALLFTTTRKRRVGHTEVITTIYSKQYVTCMEIRNQKKNVNLSMRITNT